MQWTTSKIAKIAKIAKDRRDWYLASAAKPVPAKGAKGTKWNCQNCQDCQKSPGRIASEVIFGNSGVTGNRWRSLESKDVASLYRNEELTSA